MFKKRLLSLEIKKSGHAITQDIVTTTSKIDREQSPFSSKVSGDEHENSERTQQHEQGRRELRERMVPLLCRSSVPPFHYFSFLPHWLYGKRETAHSLYKNSECEWVGEWNRSHIIYASVITLNKSESSINVITFYWKWAYNPELILRIHGLTDSGYLLSYCI